MSDINANESEDISYKYSSEFRGYWSDSIENEVQVNNQILGFIGIFIGVILGTEGLKTFKYLPESLRFLYLLCILLAILSFGATFFYIRKRAQNQRKIFFGHWFSFLHGTKEEEFKRLQSDIQNLSIEDNKLSEKVDRTIYATAVFSALIILFIVITALVVT